MRSAGCLENAGFLAKKPTLPSSKKYVPPGLGSVLNTRNGDREAAGRSIEYGP
jgi:hypothetical protein